MNRSQKVDWGKRTFFAILAIVALLLAIKPAGLALRQKYGGQEPSRASSYNPVEVESVVKVGTTLDQVIKYFGQPMHKEEKDEGYTLYDYHLPPAKNPIGKSEIGGFQLLVSNNVVTKWSYIYRTY